MSEIVDKVVKTTKQGLNTNPKVNPLFQWAFGGLGSWGGNFLYGKAMDFLTAKFPSLFSNKYAQPISKAVIALSLYGVSKVKQIRKVPFMSSMIFGAGIGIFGTMVSDWAVGTASGYIGKSEGSSIGTGKKIAAQAPRAPTAQMASAQNSGISRFKGKIFGV
ncbi:hypothetical protein [Candidatus Lokiarchaeum ossiferum]|uniref:hypothetical protein n=1 Tax=Candidatus Lokiarchaeum ossiferum TaxID=2951803 RepID=UPI00352E6077